jgi:hypothetical protein
MLGRGSQHLQRAGRRGQSPPAAWARRAAGPVPPWLACDGPRLRRSAGPRISASGTACAFSSSASRRKAGTEADSSHAISAKRAPRALGAFTRAEPPPARQATSSPPLRRYTAIRYAAGCPGADRAAAAPPAAWPSAGSTDPRGTCPVGHGPAAHGGWPPPPARPREKGRLAPTSFTSPLSNTRSSRACNSSGSSPTSSWKRVPPCASSKAPRRLEFAPVKAPFLWPNSSLSITAGARA